jgi:glycosyltransferase involved in cell wall biosynthesis
MTKRVRVLFVAPYAQQAGGERYLELLLEGMPRDAVAKVVLLQRGPLVERLEAIGFAPMVIPTGRRVSDLARSARQLRAIVRELRPNVIHANGLKAAIVAVPAARGRAAVVWMKHDLNYDGLLARAVARGCRVVVAPSQAALECFGARPRTRTLVVPNGLPQAVVDRPRQRRVMLDALAASEPIRIVALVGRFHPLKGHLELLAVARPVADAIPNVRFVFVGADDPNMPAYGALVRDRIAAEGLETLVTLLGHRPDASELVGGCDVVAMPSRAPEARHMGTEAFGLAALEAMIAGTPCVGYATGGIPEVVRECGSLVPEGDRAGLARELVAVLSDAALRARLGECGRTRAAADFSLSSMIEAMLSCYEEAAR